MVAETLKHIITVPVALFSIVVNKNIIEEKGIQPVQVILKIFENYTIC